jgi:hypothetical protein
MTYDELIRLLHEAVARAEALNDAWGELLGDVVGGF